MPAAAAIRRVSVGIAARSSASGVSQRTSGGSAAPRSGSGTAGNARMSRTRCTMACRVCAQGPRALEPQAERGQRAREPPSRRPGRARLGRWEEPHPAQQRAGLADEQQTAVLFGDRGRHVDAARPRLLAAPGESLGGARAQRRAEGRGRTGGAVGASRPADLLAEVHESGGQVARPPGRQQRRGAAAHRGGVGGRAGLAVDGEEPRDDPGDVGVDGGHPRAEGERGDGRRHVIAEARKGREDLRIARDAAAVPREQGTGGGAEISGAGVVAEPRPRCEHARFAGPGERRQIREPLEERAVPAAHGGDGRLLEHDLRYPDPVGIGGPAPGEGAFLASKPVEQRAADRRRAVAGQEAVTSVRGAIQSGSRMTLRTNAFSSSLGRTSATCRA